MMNTMIELTIVSRRVGQVTLETSERTWFRKVKGFVFAAMNLPELRNATGRLKSQIRKPFYRKRTSKKRAQTGQSSVHALFPQTLLITQTNDCKGL